MSETFHLHDFVKFCLCISLHVCVLSSEGAVCVCLCVCVCVRESKQGFFHALFWFHTGKSGIYSPPKPVHRAPVRTSCQKPTPAAFPLCLYQEIITTRLGWGCALCQGPSSRFIFIRSSSCIYHLFSCCFYSLWRLMFVTRKTPHSSATCLSLSVFSVENQETASDHAVL